MGCPGELVRGGDSLELQDGVRRAVLERVWEELGPRLLGTSLAFAVRLLLKFSLPVPHSAGTKRTPHSRPWAEPACCPRSFLPCPVCLSLESRAKCLPLTALRFPIFKQDLPHVMEVSTLRESLTMASPPPREMEEELVPAGSEPGTHGCRVELMAKRRAGRAQAAPPFCSGG